MKIIFTFLFTCGAAFALNAQVESDKPIVLTGTDGERYVTGLELPVNAVDAANKAYVDAAVSGSGGGGAILNTLGDGGLPTTMSAESSTTMNFVAAIDYCRNLDESTYTDWRFPSYEEVIYMRANDATYANIPSPSSTNNFWVFTLPSMPIGSSSGSGQWGSAMNFGNSTLTTWLISNTANNRARCVR